MLNLERYRRYFDQAYPAYGNERYENIALLVDNLPTLQAFNTLLKTQQALEVRELLAPLILIKNYKSQTPFPSEPLDVIGIILQIRTHIQDDLLSEHLQQPFFRLLESEGFQLPTISAIFHFCDRLRYPIVDRNIEAACALLASQYPDEIRADTVPTLPGYGVNNLNKLGAYRKFISFLTAVRLKFE